MKRTPTILLAFIVALQGCYYLKPHQNIIDASYKNYWKGSDTTGNYLLYVTYRLGTNYSGVLIHASKADSITAYKLRGFEKGSVHPTSISNDSISLGHIFVVRRHPNSDTIVIEDKANQRTLPNFPKEVYLYKVAKKGKRKGR